MNNTQVQIWDVLLPEEAKENTDWLYLKGAETNLYTFRYWLFSESIQICFRALYVHNYQNSYVSCVKITPIQI